MQIQNVIYFPSTPFHGQPEITRVQAAEGWLDPGKTVGNDLSFFDQIGIFIPLYFSLALTAVALVPVVFVKEK
jgi:hypothetical protein